MNINDILKLIDKLNETSINELSVTEDKFKLHLSKNKTNAFASETPLLATTSETEKITLSKATNDLQVETTSASDRVIKSPLVGIYYESSSPEVNAFVAVGQKVKEGDVVCIIEAMKIFNEIKSPYTGIVKKILPSNLEVVEYDQELIVIGEE